MTVFGQPRHPNTWSKNWPVALALAFVLSNLLSWNHFGLGAPGRAGTTAPSGQALAAPRPDGGGQAVLGRPVTGKRIQLHWSTAFPTPSAQERQALQAAQAAQRSLKVPTGPIHHLTAAEAAALRRTAGPPLPLPRTASQAAPQADSDFDVELNQSVSSAGICGSCSAASTLSPSVANDGQDLWMTGNYYAATSTNNGTTWSALDPFAEAISIGNRFFVGFQQVLYEPSRDTFFWSLGAANSPGGPIGAIILVTQTGNLGGTACGREFDPQILGLGGTVSALGNPDIEYSANYLYLSFDAYNTSGSFVSSGVARLPLSALAAGSGCGGVTPQVVSRTDNFHFTLGQGATDTMYWLSNDYLSGPTTGNHVRVFFWPESSISFTFQDKTIDAYTFLAPGLKSNCGSQDGVVTDWCLFVDSTAATLYRSRAGYRGFGAPLLGMAWTAGPSSLTTFPYVVRYYFLLANMAYKGQDNLYNRNYAVAWPSLAAPVQRGYVGGTFTYGGGTGQQDYYPANGLLIEDPDTPTQPWATDLFTGSGNLGSGIPYTLGPYNTARAWAPDGLHWIAAGEGGTMAAIAPYVVVFGRGRDHNAYLRWANT